MPAMAVKRPGSVFHQLRACGCLSFTALTPEYRQCSTSETSKRLGTRIDGFLGQDILREFSAVRIDYKGGVIEFEK
jgi:hypothetical protein